MSMLKGTLLPKRRLANVAMGNIASFSLFDVNFLTGTIIGCGAMYLLNKRRTRPPATEDVLSKYHEENFEVRSIVEFAPSHTATDHAPTLIFFAVPRPG